MKKKNSLMLIIVGIISLVLVTVAFTYAFFNYAKEGTTDNTITTSTITFLYTEIDKVGNGISINEAYPISDTQGKMLSGATEVFDFKITSTTPNTSSIRYEITARKNSDSTLDEDAVKLYLTKVTGTSEEEVLLSKYSDLTQTSKVTENKYTEKTIYTGKVPANSESYEQAFKLRMWIANDVDFSPVEGEDGSVTYPYNDKEFTITVNVYANAKVVTEEEMLDASKAEISSLSVNGEELTPVENQDYNYEISLPEGTTSTTLDIETIGEYATVTVEKLDSLALETSSVKRLSTKKTLDLNPGDNYFKITVTSEDGKVFKEYRIKIIVSKDCTYLIGTSWDYYYTNFEEQIRILCPGNYMLETWGAQGGTRSPEVVGGYGAYAVGNVNLTLDEILYINVGGVGIEMTGGYNGGGSGIQDNQQFGAGGGGATSISIKSGILSSFSNNVEENLENILIIAAGGGGTGYSPISNDSGVGGAGGGFQGNDGFDPTTWKYYYGTGATQLQGGKSYAGANHVVQSGTFGKAGNGRVDGGGSGGSGGGGGLYGGGGSSRGHGGAGGGSSYIGNTLLTNKAMYCYNCATSDDVDTKTISVTINEVSNEPISRYAKIGDGYAKITYLGN